MHWWASFVFLLPFKGYETKDVYFYNASSTWDGVSTNEQLDACSAHKTDKADE